MQVSQEFGQEPNYTKHHDLQMLVYVSQYVGAADKSAFVINRIVNGAIPKNLKRVVSGMLYFHKGKFIQVLEGQPLDLEATMQAVGKASSHKNIEILARNPISERGFHEWNMGALNFDETQTIDPKFFQKVVDLYKSILMPKADALISVYQQLIKDPEFAKML